MQRASPRIPADAPGAKRALSSGGVPPQVSRLPLHQPQGLLATPRSFFSQGPSGLVQPISCLAGSCRLCRSVGPRRLRNQGSRGTGARDSSPGWLRLSSAGRARPARWAGLSVPDRPKVPLRSFAAPIPKLQSCCATHGHNSPPGPVLGRKSETQFRKHQEPRAVIPTRVGPRVFACGRVHFIFECQREEARKNSFSLHIAATLTGKNRANGQLFNEVNCTLFRGTYQPAGGFRFSACHRPLQRLWGEGARQPELGPLQAKAACAATAAPGRDGSRPSEGRCRRVSYE